MKLSLSKLRFDTPFVLSRYMQELQRSVAHIFGGTSVYGNTLRGTPALFLNFTMGSTFTVASICNKLQMKKHTFSVLIGFLLFIVLIVAGCSDDSTQTDVVFTYDFSADSEGWVAGFADLPANHDPAFYQLAASHQKLPSGLLGNGLYIQGDNHSDDLFMFFKRQITGLEPSTIYRINVLIKLATNVPAGLVGIGGAPGEDVYVKAGATTTEPLIVTDNLGWLRMNIDKGNQSQGGQDMLVIGNVAHPGLDDASGNEYKIKTLSEAGQSFEAMTDSNGTLWFIVGTDSGFEGLTTLYYSRLSFSLTKLVS